MEPKTHPDTAPKFPHQSTVLKPVETFPMGRRTLCLYWHAGRGEDMPYLAYWQDAPTGKSLQTGMSAKEAFHLVAEELRKASVVR